MNEYDKAIKEMINEIYLLYPFIQVKLENNSNNGYESKTIYIKFYFKGELYGLARFIPIYENLTDLRAYMEHIEKDIMQEIYNTMLKSIRG